MRSSNPLKNLPVFSHKKLISKVISIGKRIYVSVLRSLPLAASLGQKPCGKFVTIVYNCRNSSIHFPFIPEVIFIGTAGAGKGKLTIFYSFILETIPEVSL